MRPSRLLPRPVPPAFAGLISCLRSAAFLVAAGALAQPSASFPPLLFAAEGVGKIVRYDATGAVAWEHPAPMARDVWALPNGHVLFCYNEAYDSRRHDNPSGVREVTPDHRIVFEFRTTGQVWSCQRLPDGRTLVGAASQGKLLLVDAAGRLERALPLVNAPGHSCLRHARQLANGHFLVAEESARAVREYAADGRLVRTIRVPFPPFTMLRRPDGRTLIAGQQRILEVDTEDRVTWSLTAADVPTLGLRWFAGLQLAKDGSLLVSNAGGKVTFARLAPDKSVLWQSNPPDRPAFPVGHGFCALD